MPLPVTQRRVRSSMSSRPACLAHDVGFLGDHTERGFDVDLEMLFNRLIFLAILGSPRPHIRRRHQHGGDTKRRFGGCRGICWIQKPVPYLAAIFLTASLGGATRRYLRQRPGQRKKLGSPALSARAETRLSDQCLTIRFGI